MDPKKIAKQTFDFYRSTFENTFKALSMLQEQSQRMMDMYLEQTSGFPEEGKKAIREWVNAYRKGSQDFKKAVDESFARVDQFFSAEAKEKK
ncbi:MAG TPA: hypothetical protein PKY58_01150 [Syntrophales bacterium]|nr:hypothetical protein [Syntrophales bacterium]HQB29248.1 hypothetical protein [Syntrophales bacterium]HQN76753.1 hypothetical protein [Syntrophales bacterium]HQQ26106.1 hypothetical protein [Syntrophales bacterium]